MAGRNWLRARPVGLVLVLTLAPSALLVVLGWRLFREDRDAELRTVRERREYAAARVGSALERAFHQIETRLSESAGADLLLHLAQVSDAAVVTMHDGMIEVRPADRLAYLPNTMNWIDTSGTFSRGEFLEYRNKDPREAINWYREAARRAEAGDKAGALLRLARALRRDGKADEALATYSSVSRLPASVDGV